MGRLDLRPDLHQLGSQLCSELSVGSSLQLCCQQCCPLREHALAATQVEDRSGRLHLTDLHTEQQHGGGTQQTQQGHGRQGSHLKRSEDLAVGGGKVLLALAVNECSKDTMRLTLDHGYTHGTSRHGFRR